MSKYETYEDNFCTLLTNVLYDIKPLPDNEQEFSRNFQKPQIYVAYAGSSYSESESTSLVTQEETMTFDFMFRVRSRVGSSGLLAILEYVSKKIIGYKILGCKKIQLVSQGYVDGTQNNWNFIMTISLVSHIIENQALEEATAPKFGNTVKSENNEIEFKDAEV